MSNDYFTRFKQTYINNGYKTTDIESISNDIVYYYDLLSGLGSGSKNQDTIKSKSARLYCKIGNDNNQRFICAFPYSEMPLISITNDYENAQASWVAKAYQSFQEGRRDVLNFVGQIQQLIETALTKFGKLTNYDTEDIRKMTNQFIDEMEGDSPKSASEHLVGVSDTLQNYKGSKFTNSSNLDLKQTLMSSDSLLKVLKDRCKAENAYDVNFAKNKNYQSQINNAIRNNQPVRAYLFYLLQYCSGYIELTDDNSTFKHYAPLGKTYSTAGDTIALNPKGNGNNILAGGVINRPYTFYLICGDGYLINNLNVTSMQIRPSDLLTPTNDYFSAEIDISLSPDVGITSLDVENWLVHTMYLNDKGVY